MIKTSCPKVSFHEKNKCWRIRRYFYSHKYEKGKRMETGGYPTEDEANNDIINYRESIEKNDEWIPYNKRSKYTNFKLLST